MVNFARELLYKLRFTQTEIKWRENVLEIGTGDIRKGSNPSSDG